jgi:hypothetical protein
MNFAFEVGETGRRLVENVAAGRIKALVQGCEPVPGIYSGLTIQKRNC